ncbi:MAG: glycosyltransferase family 4 protein [Chloroflexota bacterium]|nr:glycosyltransferase family 4 protein [Chloroflexota bacterium]
MIGVNATILGDRPTGLGVYTHGLIDALRKQGEDLDVITLPRPMGHAGRILWLQTALGARLARSRPAVLLNPLPEAPLLPPVPQVTVVHDLIPLFYPGRARIPRAHLYFRYVVPLVIRSSRAVIADSEATKRDVVARYRLAPERVHVAYPGYDAERFRPDPADVPADPPYLLYVGNVAPHKNLVRLVEAFAQVAPGTSATLVMRGSGRPWHVEPVRRRIEELGIGDRVDWEPYEDAATLPRLYRCARAVVLPSLYEGFGLTALEAMACGTPVIAARAASVPEVTGDVAVLVDPRDAGALSAAMSDLLGSDALAADLRARGLERARLFSWERTAERVGAHLHPRR